MTEFPKRHFLLWEKQREQIAHDLKACQAGIYDDKMLNRLEAVATHLGKEAADSGDEAFASLAQHLAQLLTYLQNDKLVLNLFLIDLIQRSFEAIEAYITALNSGLSLPDHAKLDTELQENLASSSEWALKKVGVDIATDAPSDSPTISLPLIRPPSKATPDGQCINQSVAESSIYVEGSNLPHIPIDPDKLDGLFKIFNEMLSIRASLSEGNASNIESRNQDNDLDKLDDLIQSANNYTLSLQTQKIEGLFSQIIPIIEHRYAQKNKFITFSIIGGDTKIDKRIVISVGEALLELVDNAALHGIESAEDRQKVSKPENGRICLEAKCHASRLRIAITDDGRGIIWENLITLAEKYGLIADKDKENNKDTKIFKSIYKQKEKSGLAHVKRIIQSLRGEVSIYAPPNIGTRVTLFLPLNQMMIEGLIARVKQQSYIFPISDITESIAVEPKDIHWVDDKQSMIKLRDKWLPAIALSSLIGGETFHKDSFKEGRKILIHVDSTIHQPEITLIVDTIESQRQLVVQNLETNFQAVRGITGAALMENGEMALVVDLESLLHSPPPQYT